MNPGRTIFILMFVLGSVLLTTGCISQPSVGDNTPPVTLKEDTRIPIQIPDPNFTPYVPGGNQLLITDFPGFLAKWNERMHWGYSPQQIENYSRMLETGMLKKYKKFPDFPTLDIPDLKPFCLEVGDAIGLSKNQSEAFAYAADDELRRDKITWMSRNHTGSNDFSTTLQK